MHSFPSAALLGTISLVLAVVSCHPTEPDELKRPRHEAAVLNYTMLGIWPERYQAYGISSALGQAGIRSTLSGVRPCILNVETPKLAQAKAIIFSNPNWSETATIIQGDNILRRSEEPSP